VNKSAKKPNIIAHFQNPSNYIFTQKYVLAKFKLNISKTLEVTALQRSSNQKN